MSRRANKAVQIPLNTEKMIKRWIISLNLWTRARCPLGVGFLLEEDLRKRHGLSVQRTQVFDQEKCNRDINNGHDGKIRSHNSLSMKVSCIKWENNLTLIITFSDAVKKTLFPLWKLQRVFLTVDLKFEWEPLPLTNAIYESRSVTKISSGYKRTECCHEFKKSQRDLFWESS